MKNPSNYKILHHIISKWSILSNQDYADTENEIFSNTSIRKLDMTTSLSCLLQYFHLTIEQAFSMIQYEREHINDPNPIYFIRYINLLKTCVPKLRSSKAPFNFSFFTSLETIYILLHKEQFANSEEELRYLLLLVSALPYDFLHPLFMKQEESEDTPLFFYNALLDYKRQLEDET